MGRIRLLIAVAVCAAVLGLGAAFRVGARLCNDIASLGPDNSQARPQQESTPAGESPAGSVAEAATEDGDTAEVRPSSRSKRRRARLPAVTATDDPFLDELGRGVTKLGEHRYEIKASALALALGNLGLLGRAARVAPDVRAGKPAGFRLVWVKADGPLAKLGVRAEDVLVAINGLDLATPDHVLDAYGKLKAARFLALEVERGGQRQTIEYAIR
jgi:membrane-associated protease RseP (regulator of RpoE activity)